MSLTILLCYGHLRCSRIPARQFENQTWLKSESLSEIPIDATVEKMIKAAVRDHYLAPLNGQNRKISFLWARSVPPNDIYLSFWAGVSDTTIRYRGDRESSRLYWKTVVSE